MKDPSANSIQTTGGAKTIVRARADFFRFNLFDSFFILVSTCSTIIHTYTYILFFETDKIVEMKWIIWFLRCKSLSRPNLYERTIDQRFL